MRQTYRTSRDIDFMGFSGNAAGQFDGTQYNVSALAGYPIRLDAATTWTPIAGLTYSRLNLDAYTETGSVAALRVDGTGTTSIGSDLNAKLERAFKTSVGELTPSAQLSWRHEYRNTGVLVLRSTLARSENLTLSARYTLEATHAYTAQTADVRLRYQF